eukprot:COSAG01_NODE_2087_length_8456_cov_2.656456_7_plen_52_part_00
MILMNASEALAVLGGVRGSLPSVSRSRWDPKTHCSVPDHDDKKSKMQLAEL